MTHYIAVTCSAMARYVYSAAAGVPSAVSVRMLDQGLHIGPKTLRERLQDEIDAIEPDECDAILLVYGICGTSTLGLIARHTPIVIPRTHDCIALYLGSHDRYKEEFDAEPGTYWYSVDYMERKGGGGGIGASFTGDLDAQYEGFVKKYGKDNADYLMEVMGNWGEHYKRAVFIDTGVPDSDGYEDMTREQAETRGWNFERKIGDPRLVEMLIRGDWQSDEFLVVPPGHKIEQSFDERLIDAVPV